MCGHTVALKCNSQHQVDRPVRRTIGKKAIHPLRPVISLACVALAVSLVYPVAAPAGPCGDEIARVEQALGQAQANPQLGPSAPESAGALLHRQPTPQSVERAQTQADEKTNTALAQARKLNAEGRESECISALEPVAVPLGVR